MHTVTERRTDGQTDHIIMTIADHTVCSTMGSPLHNLEIIVLFITSRFLDHVTILLTLLRTSCESIAVDVIID